MNIIYIVGYGRSGTTLMDRALGSIRGVLSCGEVVNFGRLMDDKDHACSCGELLADCPLWSTVVSELSASKKSELDVIDRIQTRVGRNGTIVDSSKSAFRHARRPYVLRGAGHRVLPVLVWRNPVEVLRSRAAARNRLSNIQRSYVTADQVFRGLAGWIFANCAALWTIYRLKGVIVGFEELIDSQELVANDLITAFGLILENSDLEGEHLVSGNRMRNRSVADGPSKELRPDMLAWHRMLVRCVTAPIVYLLLKQSSKNT